MSRKPIQVDNSDLFDPSITQPDNTKYRAEYINSISAKIGTIGVDNTEAATVGTPSVEVSTSGSDTSKNIVFKFKELKGVKGDQGEQGEQGDAATIKIGTVQKGDTATVINSGTEQDAVLNFTLPKGDKGDTGETGAQGSVLWPTTRVDSSGYLVMDVPDNTSLDSSNVGIDSDGYLYYGIPDVD